jgi:hypothetical protein
MGVIITSSSDYGKELAKWEMFPQPWAPSPGRPFMQREFPLMVYRATVRFDGKVSVGEGDDRTFGGAPGSAEQFTRQCQRIVNDEDELKRAQSEGWRRTQKEALEQAEKEQRFLETAAAHRAHEDRNMSEAAKKEAAEADAATPEHVAEVPEKPRLHKPPEPAEEDTEVLDDPAKPRVKRKYTRRTE